MKTYISPILIPFALFVASASAIELVRETLNTEDFEAILEEERRKEISEMLDCSFWLYDTSTVYLNSWSNSELFPYVGKTVSFDEFTVLQLDSTRWPAVFPLKNKVNSPFKSRGAHRWHNGIDIQLKTGEKIASTFEGVVRYSGFNSGGFGNLVIIRHPNGLETYYAHLSKRLVSANQKVHAGQIVGLGGSTGRSDGPHLHFEIRIEDRPINPEILFDLKNFSLVRNELQLTADIFPPERYIRN